LKNKALLSIILAGSIFVGILLLDLLTKAFIIPNIIPNVGDKVVIIPNLISFVYVKNTGAAWGIFGGGQVFLIVISAVVLALFIAFYVLRVKKVGNRSSMLLGISVGLIAGGCIGNMVDRIFLGYVRDFINFEFMNFPVFNFADIALTFGVIIMIIYFLFFFTKENGAAIEINGENKNERR
jgi:signal peptidase II